MKQNSQGILRGDDLYDSWAGGLPGAQAPPPVAANVTTNVTGSGSANTSTTTNSSVLADLASRATAIGFRAMRQDEYVDDYKNELEEREIELEEYEKELKTKKTGDTIIHPDGNTMEVFIDANGDYHVKKI